MPALLEDPARRRQPQTPGHLRPLQRGAGMTASAVFDSPLGRLVVTEDGGRITRLAWGGGAQGDASALLDEAGRQLAEYFAGTRRAFDLPLDWGEGFDAEARRAMAAIPYGETRTYGDLARDLGATAQVVGQACGANRIPVIIPCHRVLAATGLGGYSGAGGIETKVALLKLEGAASLLI
jgi:methylated-DNA-[protein]-cysteine S-methyltransferase